jgi:cytochrome P450
VLLSQWVTHRDARWWTDPQAFAPLRFAEDARSNRPRWAYFPFGGGSRGCIGESFAWMEAVLVLATIVQQWTMRYEGHAAPALRPLITLRPAGSVPMRVMARSAPSTR